MVDSGSTSFVDEAQIHAKAGNGGAGAVSFRREAHVDRGGPDGGDGGRGGSVILEARADVVSLLGFRDHPFRRASDGGHGGGKRRHGRRGEDLIVPVPVGTVVRDRRGEVLADLAAPADRFLCAEGGRGGRGNAGFLTNRLRAPAFGEQAELGEESWFDLELRLLADVALVGFPNAGKSTLIARISAARPKIADYPFTTLVPVLGVVRRPDGADFVVADIPGLIEGASQGKGLGLRFLQHVERARVLVVLLDCGLDRGLSLDEQQRILEGELAAYRPDLLDRARLVVASRADLDPDALARAGRPELPALSAVTGEGVDELVRSMAGLVERARSVEPPDRKSVV